MTLISFVLSFAFFRVGYFPLVTIRAFLRNQLKPMGVYGYIIFPIIAMQLMWFWKILILARKTAAAR